MIDASQILEFKQKLKVIIPHLQEIQSSAYAAKENLVAKYAAIACNALYDLELDLDKPKPYTQEEWKAAMEKLSNVEQ